MDILFRALGSPARLDRWEARPFAPGTEAGPGPTDHRDVYERIVASEQTGAPEAQGVHRRLAAAICGYEIFPPSLVTGVLRRRPVQNGDTVGILYHAPLGIELFFAARVIDCFDGPQDGSWRSGFTYRTLAGHPELGEETFAVEKELATGTVRVALRSWSRPGTWLARAGKVLVRQLQIRASLAALDQLGATAATRSL